MKYVVLGGPRVLVFDENIPHRIVCELPGSPNICRAGFCSLEGGQVQVWGKSEGLGKESMESDAEIIADAFGLIVHPIPKRCEPPENN